MDDKTRCSQSYEKNNTEWSYCNTDAMVFTCVGNTIQQWCHINCADVEQRRGSEWISWFLSWFLVIMTRGCRTAATALLQRDLVRLNSHLLSCFVSALRWGPAQRCDDEQSFVCQPCESSPPLQLLSSLRQQEQNETEDCVCFGQFIAGIGQLLCISGLLGKFLKYITAFYACYHNFTNYNNVIHEQKN